MLRRSLSATILFLLAGCALFPRSTTTATPSPPTAAPTLKAPTATPVPSVPPPSYRVAAFYYPWYGTPQLDGNWLHWNQNGRQPPQDIASDYYPALGPYSSGDPAVLEQHMVWLRQAGIGVIIVSWWGIGSQEDRAVPAILRAAAGHNVKVAFHIEPYAGRTADGLLAAVKYIYQQYGTSPAFFTSSATTTYSSGSKPTGMFFVWCTTSPGICGQEKVNANYWQPAVDAIHALPQGGLVIANTTDSTWISGGHFDGLYNYATRNLEQHGGFAWAGRLPPGSLYIPSVLPGFSAVRIGEAADISVPRDDGQTYNDQWTAALNTGVQPAMVTITSFNEWHEGTMIEPIALGKNDGKGYAYAGFDALPPDGYLELTRQWIAKFLKSVYQPAQHAAIQVTP